MLKVKHLWEEGWSDMDSDSDEEDGDLCCGFTKEHLEAFLFKVLMCWNSTFRKQKRPKYSQYRPLGAEDEEGGEEMSMSGGMGFEEGKEDETVVHF